MNSKQLIDNDDALRLFFNDDIYVVDAESIVLPQPTVSTTGASVVAPTIAHVAEPQIAPTPEVKTAYNFKHLGKNEKSILILVNDGVNPVSTPQGTELLRKLVLSINLKNADFALVNYANYPNASFADLEAFFGCKMFLSFGVTAPDLGLPLQLLHQLHSINDVKMIFTYNLHDLDADLNAKKALWGTLKNLKND